MHSTVPEIIALHCILNNGAVAEHDTASLLDCLFYSETYYAAVLKDTTSGSKWTTQRRKDAAYDFRLHVLNELKRRENDANHLQSES